MKKKLSNMSVEQLVDRYVEIGLEQNDASLWLEDVPRFNSLFRQLRLVEEELKRRDGDARRALRPLYGHKSFQVRLNAAKATLAVARAEAEAELRAIQSSNHMPQAGDAGMSLWLLEEGIFRPD